MLGVLAAILIVAVVIGIAVVQSRGRVPAGPAPLAAAGAVTVPMVRPTDPVGRIVFFLRQRKWLRRSMSVVSVALLLVAAGVIGYPFYTNLVQSRIQARLDRQIASPELRQAYLDRRVAIGDSLTRIIIPRIDVDVVVVEGTTANALRAGAGHYVSTPLPCEQGNVGIAGHRTTYGRPFNNIDLLRPGDKITLQTPIGSCTYEVSKNPFIIEPTDGSVLRNTPDAQLTLTTCHPKGSARQRLIVQATLVSTDITP